MFQADFPDQTQRLEEVQPQVLFGDGDNTARTAMNGGDGGAPVSLSGDEPRTDLPIDGLMSAVLGFKCLTDGRFRFTTVKPVKPFHGTVDHPTEVDFSLRHGC